MQEKYCLDFILRCHGSTLQAIKNALSEFGDHLEITEDAESQTEARDFKICIVTEEPTLVFDVCSQFGRIKSMKVNEERRP